LTACILAFVLLGAASPVLAHHGTTVTYDTSSTITVSGTVSEFDFAIPHVQIYFNV